MTTGFKDWKLICEALGSGKQDIIFRKGGIHEGREGFAFKHEAFFLFPTLFHAQQQMCTESEGWSSEPTKQEWQPGDQIDIEYYCRATKAETLTSWEAVAALRSRHIWKDEVIRERYDWEGKGMASGSIHVAYVETFQLPEVWSFPYEKRYGGCRSWLELPEPPADIQEWVQNL